MEELYEWCLDATVWFDAKPGYLGAYFDDGFSPKVLLQVVEELRVALPNVIGDLNLKTAWAYKYDSQPQNTGIAVHADPAAARQLLRHAGRRQLGAAAQLADFSCVRPPVPRVPGRLERHRRTRARMRAHLDQLGARTGKRRKPLRVPYKRNRAVIFDSSLLHETDRFRFKRGYRHRRINLTLLRARARSGDDGAARALRGSRCRERDVRDDAPVEGRVDRLMTYYVERVLACSRKEAKATASRATPAARRATAHAVALCARALHAAGDRRLAIEVLQSRQTHCGSKAAASEAEWRARAPSRAHQDSFEATAASFAASLDDVLRWQRRAAFWTTASTDGRRARAVVTCRGKSKFYGAFVLNRRVVLHAIDATPAR